MKNFILVIIVTFTHQCIAQDSLQFNHKEVGIGADILDERFYFPIFISDQFKIEPELKFYLRFDDPHANDSKSIEIGSGFFYTLNYSQLVPYFGLRFGYSYYDNEYTDYNSQKESGIYISPTIGGEYFLFERFSLGIELLAKYTHTDGKATYREGEREIKRRGFQTSTYFILRVYLF